MTGKSESGQASRLCKRYLYARFLRLLAGRLVPLSPNLGPSHLSHAYADAKRLNTAYVTARGCLVDAFRRAELGEWVKKPIEQDMFHTERDERPQPVAQPTPPPPPQPQA